jgi:hypothetical protein
MSVVVRVPISISTSTLRLFFREISEWYSVDASCVGV